MQKKNLSRSDHFHAVFPKQFKMTTKKKLSNIKFAYVTNDTANTSVKNHMYHTTPGETVICDSDGVTGDHI
jgi:hypothetical protein